MRILTEATGGLTSGYLIRAIQSAGAKAVGSDIHTSNHGAVLCDDFILMPLSKDPNLWEFVYKVLRDKEIDMVIPSLDETLLEWSKRSEEINKLGTKVILSPPETVEICQDKWKTYCFFNSIGINTPKTSLGREYPLIKPRLGRGGSGIFIQDESSDIDMDGMISQELVDGVEFTVDCFFDNSGNCIYAVPRSRESVVEGKSVRSFVKCDQRINEIIKRISSATQFNGPVNFQLFKTSKDELVFIEINPRIAGGMALGFEATENWIELMIRNFMNNETISPKEVRDGLRMYRYYSEVYD